MNIILWGLTTILLILSFAKDKEKTFKALKKAWKKLTKIFALFFFVMALTSIAISFVPPELINYYIGKESGINGVLLALGFGSVSVIPGFIAFPLGATLRTQGIPFYIIGAFTLSLMTVGFVTFPLEKKFLGTKIAITRNVLSLIISIITALVIKMVFGE